jgi:integrase
MKHHLNELVVKNLPFCEGQTDYWDATLPRFGLRVGKRTKTFILNAGKRRITLGRYPLITLKQARDEARRRLAAKYFPQPSIPAQFAVEEYLRAKQHAHKPSTHRVYSTYLRLLQKPVREIDARYVYSILPDGKGAGNLAFNVIKAFLSWCAERDYIAHNPLLRRRQPNKLKSRDRLLTDEEIRLIWNESYNHKSFGQLIRFLILTGQRLNQIHSLQSFWIHQAEQVIVFPDHIMKGNAQHTIPLGPYAVMETTRITLHKNSYCFPNRDPAVGRKRLQAALPQIPHWTPHDFRRYFSSTMAKLGTPIEVTERLLAHKTGALSPIAQVYNRHTYLDEMRTAIIKYEEHLFSFVERRE